MSGQARTTWDGGLILFDEPSDVAVSSFNDALLKNREAVGRLFGFLKAISKRTLFELELLIERPPKLGLFREDNEIVVSNVGNKRDTRGEVILRTYRVEIPGEAQVTFEFEPNGSRIVKFEAL